MSQMKGLLVTCDRCGRKKFRKLEAPKEFDRWDKFEDAEKGWSSQNMGIIQADLCPDCTQAYASSVRQFMRKQKNHDTEKIC